MAANRVALYASVGPELTHYDVDVEAATLTRRGTVTLPANVHYCWPHASRPILYAASSDSASGVGGFVGSNHHVTALAIDPASGALSRLGEPIALPTRPIHMTTDIPSEYILVAFSNPSGLRVYRVNPDGTPGAEVEQPEPVDPGIYGHQVRVSLDNRKVILVTRGHDAAGGKPEEPGALKVFDYNDGKLTNEVSVAPNGGYGFGPRHLDFHPTKPWVYVALERQNRLDLFKFDENGALSPEADLPHRHARRTAQYPRPAGGRHGACASERPHRLCREPRLLDGRGQRRARLCRRRELARRVRHRSAVPACRRRSSTSIRAASIAAPSISTRAGACWSRRTSWGCRCAKTAAPVSSRPACRCSASGPAAGSNSSANTMSMSATGRCGGWAWWRCRRARRRSRLSADRLPPLLQPAMHIHLYSIVS